MYSMYCTVLYFICEKYRKYLSYGILDQYDTYVTETLELRRLPELLAA
jgi:hypothetical protein